MGIALDQKSGKSEGGPGSSTTVTFGVSPAAGATIFVGIFLEDTNSLSDVNTVADNKSQTSTRDVDTGAANDGGANFPRVLLYRFSGTVAGVTTITITFKTETTSNFWTACAVSYTGLTNTTPLDKSSTGGTSAAGSTMPAAALSTGALAQASELMLAFMEDGSATGTTSWTEPTGFTSEVKETAGASFNVMDFADQVVNSTASVSVQWTSISPTGDGACLVATYKGASTLTSGPLKNQVILPAPSPALFE